MGKNKIRIGLLILSIWFATNITLTFMMIGDIFQLWFNWFIGISWYMIGNFEESLK